VRARASLGVAIAICLIGLAAVLARPLRVRSAVRAYDLAERERVALRAAVESRGKEAVPALLQRALSPGCRSRGRLVSLLHEMEPEETYHALAKALKERRPEQQVCGAEALGLLGRADARPLLEWASRSENPLLEAAAQNALEQLNEENQ